MLKIHMLHHATILVCHGDQETMFSLWGAAAFETCSNAVYFVNVKSSKTTKRRNLRTPATIATCK